MKHLRSAALLVLVLLLPWVLRAQAIAMYGANSDIPKLEFGANYNYFHANAPPGHCGCFMLNGGSATVVYNITSNWAGVADRSKPETKSGPSQNVLDNGEGILRSAGVAIRAGCLYSSGRKSYSPRHSVEDAEATRH